VTADKHPTYI